MLKNKFKKTFLFFLAVLFFCGWGNAYASSSSPKSHEIKLMILCFDPVLGNRGNQKLHEYAKWDDPKTTVNGLIGDFKEVSSGLINYKVAKWIDIDDFAHLKSGLQDTDESFVNTYEAACKKHDGAWWAYDGWDFPKRDFQFDYEYYLQKYNIVDAVNKGEIDEVWVMPTEPYSCFEAMMVGKNAYWINGAPIQKDCRDFAIMGVSIFNHDANIEDFGHRMENVMTQVYNARLNSGYPGDYEKIPYDKMNTWEKFTLNEKVAPGNAACGNMHYAPNSDTDYDWGNTKEVWSTWRDWRDNFPNLTGEKQLSSAKDWGGGDLRLHHKWWFSLLPKVSGKDTDGYSQNWWDYFATSQFVNKVELRFGSSNQLDVLRLKKGDSQEFKVFGTYVDDSSRDISEDAILKSDNENVVKIESGKLIAVGDGTAIITAKMDGRSAIKKVVVTTIPKDFSIKVDSKNIKMKYTPQLVNGSVMVSAEELAKSLGAVYTWDSKKATLTIKKQKTTIVAKVDSKTVYVNGAKINLNAPAKLYKVPFIPIEFIADKMGYAYNVDNTSKIVSLINLSSVNGETIDLNDEIKFGSTTVQSTKETGNYSVLNCFDSDEKTIYISDGSDVPTYLQLNFSAPKVITKLRLLIGEPGYPYITNDWWVETANNLTDMQNKKGSYKLIVPQRFDACGSWVEENLKTPVVGKILRFNINKKVYDNFVQIHDIEIFGKNF